MFPTNGDCLIGISDAFFFCLLFTGIRHLPHVLTVPPTKACLLCATPAGMDLHIQVHARRLLPSAVPWISEDHLFRINSDTAIEKSYLCRIWKRKVYCVQAAQKLAQTKVSGYMLQAHSSLFPAVNTLNCSTVHSFDTTRRNCFVVCFRSVYFASSSFCLFVCCF